MNERILASQFAKSLRDKGFYFKIPDSFGSRFSTIKNFDAIFLQDGRFAALEYKVEKGRSFAFSKIREVQTSSLRAVTESGGSAFLILFHHTNTWKAIVFKIGEFINIQSASSRKSLPLGTYDPSWIILERKKGLWNVEPILKML